MSSPDHCFRDHRKQLRLRPGSSVSSIEYTSFVLTVKLDKATVVCGNAGIRGAAVKASLNRKAAHTLRLSHRIRWTYPFSCPQECYVMRRLIASRARLKPTNQRKRMSSVPIWWLSCVNKRTDGRSIIAIVMIAINRLWRRSLMSFICLVFAIATEAVECKLFPGCRGMQHLEIELWS